MLIMPVADPSVLGRWFKLKLLADMPPGKLESPAEEPKGRGPSIELVESGLSISIDTGTSPPMLLLWRRCRFEEAVAGRCIDIDEAPGPGLVFGGAAAMGTTPLPPTAPEEGPGPTKWLFGVLPAVLAPDVVPLTGLSISLLLAG